MKLRRADVARMIDLSAVRAGDDEARIHLLAETARRYGCVIATTLPTHTPLLARLLADTPGTGVSGNVGFPAGSSSTALKVAETRELLAAGCDEIDMVMNIGLRHAGERRPHQVVRRRCRGHQGLRGHPRDRHAGGDAPPRRQEVWHRTRLGRPALRAA